GGQRSVFGGVGRQFMQGYGDGLSGVRLQQNLWAVDVYALSALFGKGSKLLRRDCRQLSTDPLRPDKQRVNVRKRPNTSLNGRLEALRGVGLGKVDRRLPAGEKILASVLGFPGQDYNVLLITLLLCNIPRDLRSADNLAFGVFDRGNRKRNED